MTLKHCRILRQHKQFNEILLGLKMFMSALTYDYRVIRLQGLLSMQPNLHHPFSGDRLWVSCYTLNHFMQVCSIFLAFSVLSASYEKKMTSFKERVKSEEPFKDNKTAWSCSKQRLLQCTETLNRWTKTRKKKKLIPAWWIIQAIRLSLLDSSVTCYQPPKSSYCLEVINKKHLSHTSALPHKVNKVGLTASSHIDQIKSCVSTLFNQRHNAQQNILIDRISIAH